MMTAVWDLTLPDSEKLVLLALADSANDNGKCWPSMASLTRKCSKSARTVQGVIKSLVGKRFLARLEKPGRGVIYRVYPAGDAPQANTPADAAPPQPLRPRNDCAPAKSAPPQPLPLTPAAAADKPKRTINTPSKAKALLPPSGGSAPAGDEIGDGEQPPAAKGRKRDRGTRLAEDWQAPPIAELPPEVLAVVRGWTAGAYEQTALMFRNHWRAESRANGSKRDWAATWHNWLLRENSNILRAMKAGQRFDATAPAAAGATAKSPAEEAAAAAVLALKADEPDQQRQIRRLVKARIGAPAYDGWLRNTAITIDDDDTLHLACATAFIASWAQQHFEEAIALAAQEITGRELQVRIGVVRVMRRQGGEQAAA